MTVTRRSYCSLSSDGLKITTTRRGITRSNADMYIITKNNWTNS